MDAPQETLASVLSLSLHRLQRSPRAVHRAFLSRPTVFRVLRNIKGLYHADAVSFLTDAEGYNECVAQMLAQAQSSILTVGLPLTSTNLNKDVNARQSDVDVKHRHLLPQSRERLLITDNHLALFGDETLALLIQGPLARALSDLFQISFHATSKGRPRWPRSRLDLTSVEVGLSRTWITPDQAPIIECERLTLAAIRSARRFIYAEVTALTSPVIVAALISRLRRNNAPEIVVVLPKGGFLQDAAIANIRKADTQDRFRAFETSNSETPTCGPSLLIIDDQFVKIGSSQWTSRSLGAQRSVDLALEAIGRPSVVMAIARLRRERLGRLLNLEPSEFDARFLLNGSLIGTIESFFTATRSLQEFTPEATSWTQLAFTFSPVLDPKRPQAIQKWLRRRLKFGSKTWRFALILVSMFALLVMFSTLFAPLGL